MNKQSEVPTNAGVAPAENTPTGKPVIDLPSEPMTVEMQGRTYKQPIRLLSDRLQFSKSNTMNPSTTFRNFVPSIFTTDETKLERARQRIAHITDVDDD